MCGDDYVTVWGHDPQGGSRPTRYRSRFGMRGDDYDSNDNSSKEKKTGPPESQEGVATTTTTKRNR